MQNSYRNIDLSKSGALKILKGDSSLYFSDIDTSIKSMTPGEWVTVSNTKKKTQYFGFVNSLVRNDSPCLHISGKFQNAESAETYVLSLMEKAIKRRELFEGYMEGARLVYGAMDDLPGLIVDMYSNVVLVQINLAGIELFRSQIKAFLEKRFPEKAVVLWDNTKYREREMLPVHEEKAVVEEIIVNENGLKYKIARDQAQKVGFYYDHRENRRRLIAMLKKIDHNYQTGVDLFSYLGAWGLTLLSSGLGEVDFVDQANFKSSVLWSLENNSLKNSGAFFHENVFDFLKESKKTYDVVCSDPPAFCKSKKEAKKAYEGYLKLHKLALSKVNPGGLFVACSCTQYIDHKEFNTSIIEAANKLGLRLQLLDIGMQGFDHICNHFMSKESYLKYFLFKVEKE